MHHAVVMNFGKRTFLLNYYKKPLSSVIPKQKYYLKNACYRLICNNTKGPLLLLFMIPIVHKKLMHIMCLRKVCVYVCVREREREVARKSVYE